MESLIPHKRGKGSNYKIRGIRNANTCYVLLSVFQNSNEETDKYDNAFLVE